MKLVLKQLTKTGSFESTSFFRTFRTGVQILKILTAIIFVGSTLVACSGYSSNMSSEDSELVGAATAEIADSQATNNKDTQCSDFVAKVLRRTGLNVPAFHANDFDKIAAKYLPEWKMTEFTTEDLANGRSSLKQYLNSFPDHTAFLVQWPRTGQSGHVAIVEKLANDSFMIYQAQGGLNTPYAKATKVEGLLYGTVGVDRSRMRLWTE
jgi:hypothetical protein